MRTARPSPAAIFARILVSLTAALAWPICAGTVAASDAAPAQIAAKPWKPAGQLRAWTGAAEPSFVLDDVAGARLALEAGRGRPVIVHFFATWCAPCVVELPALQRLALRWQGRPLTVLAISAGEHKIAVQRFLKKRPVDFRVLIDRDLAVTRAWGVTIVPTTFLLDGTLAPRFVVEEDYDWGDPAIDRVLEDLLSAAEPAHGVAPMEDQRNK